MTNEYETIDFWKTKVKITNCENDKAWYHDKLGQVFEVDSISARDYYIKEGVNLKSVLVRDAEIVN